MPGSIIDVFHGDAFSAIALTAQLERIPHMPSMLRDSGAFTPKPIMTTALAVEERDGVLSVVQTSQRGQPTNFERTTEKRKMRYFEVPRVRVGDTIFSHELQNVREFGEATILMQLATEAARRLSGPTGLNALLDYTEENLMLGAVQGLLLDADGSTLYNWFDEFGFTAATEVGFNLSANLEFSLRPIINGIIRSMGRSAKGAFTNSTTVTALCGDAFYDAFVNHIDVVKTYYNWQAAAELRENKAWQTFPFSGINWVNYRGSDDNSTIKIPDASVKFYPVDAPGVFEIAYAPAEGFQAVNQMGQPRSIQPIFDRDRNEWWRMEASMYPLPICKRPEVLRTGRAGA